MNIRKGRPRALSLTARKRVRETVDASTLPRMVIYAICAKQEKVSVTTIQRTVIG